MKKLVIGMLAVVAMASCTKDEEVINPVIPTTDKVEIKLTAGVVDVATRAIIDGNKFDNGAEIDLLRWDAESLTDPTFATDAYTKGKATLDANGAISLADNQKYYNADGKNAYFIGIYPALEAGTEIGTDGVIKYTGVGFEKDILSTIVVSAGSKTSASAQGTNIEFEHLLSKVTIVLKGTGAAKNVFGNVTSVTMLNVPQNLDLTLGAEPKIKASTNDGAISQALATDENIDLTAEQPATLQALVVPGFGAGESPIQIRIETDKFSGEKALTVNVTGLTEGTKPGKENAITLTFKDRIDAIASIKDWEPGTIGGGEVDM